MNYLSGSTQVQLEAWLVQAREQLATGAVVMSVSAGDTSVSNRIEVSIKERINYILIALNALDPDNYPDTLFNYRRRVPYYTY